MEKKLIYQKSFWLVENQGQRGYLFSMVKSSDNVLLLIHQMAHGVLISDDITPIDKM